MKYLASVVILLAAVTFCNSISLPLYLKKCKKDDPNLGQCIVKSGNAGLLKFIEGDSAHHIAKMNPVTVSQIQINPGNNLKINLTDVAVSGLDTVVITKANMDLDKKILEFEFDFDKASLQGTYGIDGRLLILPITGNGFCNVTFVNGHIHYQLQYELKERNGKEYMTPLSNDLTYTLERAYFKLDNLFNGDEKLGEQMNLFLDENWKEVNEEIGTSIGYAIGEVLTGILGKFFNKVPYTEFFA